MRNLLLLTTLTKKSLLFIFFFGFPFYGEAQYYHEKAYSTDLNGATSHDYVQLANGHYLHVWSGQETAGFPEVSIRLNFTDYLPDGTINYEKYISFPWSLVGNTFDRDNSLVTTLSDGGFILTRTTLEGKSYIFKLNSAGNIVWQKLISPNVAGNYMQLYDIVETSAGHIIMTGQIGHFSPSFNTGEGTVVIKLSAIGNLMWSKSYHNSGDAEFYGREIIELSTGNYIVAGYHDVLTNTNLRYGFLLRLNQLSGAIISKKKYETFQVPNTTLANTFFDVDELANGTIAVTGHSKSSSDAYYPFHRLVLSSNLNTVLFSKLISLNSVGTDPDKVLISFETVASENDLFTVSLLNELNVSGTWNENITDYLFHHQQSGLINALEYETHNIPGGPMQQGLITDANSNLLISGQRWGQFLNTDFFAYLYKLDPNGIYNCSEDEPSINFPISVQVDNIQIAPKNTVVTAINSNYLVSNVVNEHEKSCCTIEFTNLSATQQVCAGGDVTLSATTSPSGAIVTWYDNTGINVGTGNTITVNPLVSTTYTVTATDGLCSGESTITVVPLPGPNIPVTEFWLCQNDPIQSFFQETLFNWFFNTYDVTGTSPGAQASLSVGFPFVTHFFNPAIAGVGDHTVEVCFNNGSQCCTEITFHVLPSPQLYIPDFTPCSSDAPFIMHSIPMPAGVSGISYSGNTSGINPFTHQFNPANATPGINTFTACYNIIAGGQCCSTYTINVLPSPNVTTSLNLTACETDPPITIASHLLNWIWVLPSGYFSPNAIPGSGTIGFFAPTPGLNVPPIFGPITFDPSSSNVGTNNITYTVINNNGCSGSATGTITVCPEPTIAINVTGNPCTFPTPITLSSSIGIMPAGCGINAYSWSGPSIISSPSASSISINGPGTYTLTVTTDGGCTSTASIVVISTPPSLSISTSDPQPCKGDTVTLSASSTGTFVSYQWTLNGVNIPGATSSTLSVTQDGIYCVTGTDINGCVSPQSCITVTFFELPPFTINGNTTICEGGDISLSIGLGGNCVSPSAQWYADGVLIGTGASLNIPSSTFPAGTIISVEFCCNGCCETVQAATVIPSVLANLDPISDIDLCIWDGIPIQLVGNSTGGNCTYSGTGVVDPVNGIFDPIAAGGEGFYSVSYTCDLNGCVSVATQTINVIENDYWHQTTFNAAVRDIGNDVITDADGNVYITGLYTRQTSFHGGNNVDVTIASGGGFSPFSFVAKYDNCANLMWVAHAKSGPTGQPNYGTSITLDEANGLVYASGNFIDEIYYFEGLGSFGTVTPPTTPTSIFASSPSNRGYVVSLNMSDGAIHSLDPIVIDDKTYADAITINETSGDIYVGGFHNGSLNPGQDFMYIRKYDPAPLTIGAPIWQLDGIGDGSHYVNDMAFDETGSTNGDLWVIGDYKIELLLNGNYINTPSNMDAFITRIEDGIAPSVAWLLPGNMQAGGSMEGNGIAIDQINHKAFVTGTYNQNDTNVFLTPDNLVNISGFNAYFMGFDQAGIKIWNTPNTAEAGTLQAHGKAAAFQNGKAYFTGWFNGNTSFSGNIPLPANINYTGTSLLHTYAVGFDANTGAGTWSNNTIDPAGTAFHNGNAIATDNFGHAFITGGYMNEMGYNVGTPASGNLISTSLTITPAVNAFTMRVYLNNGDFKSMTDLEANEIQLAEGTITVFPNPTNGKLNIKITSAISNQSQIEVYSLDGRLVLKNQISSNQTEIDMSELQTGLYLVRVLNGNNATSIQVIKTD